MSEIDPIRSRNMAAIKSKNTRPEFVVRKALFSKGFRYRLHVRRLPGSPDLVLPKYRAAVFVHGCFWHRHEGCRYFKLPKTRQEFWGTKLMANVARDSRDVQRLIDTGWRVAVVWECATKGDIFALGERLENFLRSEAGFAEFSE